MYTKYEPKYTCIPKGITVSISPKILLHRKLPKSTLSLSLLNRVPDICQERKEGQNAGQTYAWCEKELSLKYNMKTYKTGDTVKEQGVYKSIPQPVLHLQPKS